MPNILKGKMKSDHDIYIMYNYQGYTVKIQY